ncbi:MAG: acylneuraminate cytidylyltransferase [Candidatus Marinimicrobia bacterium]|nr:acylneuraminate cytidylyltransferase [Candidatus Neomarinimicrobiota bacterium]|tara:strand:- start:3134 stop:3631 length:498 start_codon:yes stop_codon:yes gene_type:complete
MEIKLIATDIDGVWTDARMYYTDQGDYMKAFSTYDGMAIQILKDLKIPVAILTSEDTQIVKQRAKKLGIKNVFINETEKLKRMHYLCKKMKIKMKNVAYIGDDLNDFDLLNNVGLSGAPSNSPILSKFCPDIITEKKGGEGAFREFVDTILNMNSVDKILINIFK